jgi:hypothetical protein
MTVPRFDITWLVCSVRGSSTTFCELVLFINGLAQALSTSTATARWSRATDTIRRWRPLKSSSTPSNPQSAPYSIRTRVPISNNGQGWLFRPDATIVWIALISLSFIGIGVPHTPKTWITAGVFRIGNRSCALNRQNRYPGNSGNSEIFTRCVQRLEHLYKGRKCL